MAHSKIFIASISLSLTDYRNTSASPFSYKAPLHLPPSSPSYAAYTLSGVSQITSPLLNLCFPNSLALLSFPMSFRFNPIPFPYSFPGAFRSSPLPGTPLLFFQFFTLYLRPQLTLPCGAPHLYRIYQALILSKFIYRFGSSFTLLTFSTIASPSPPLLSSTASHPLNKWTHPIYSFAHKIPPLPMNMIATTKCPNLFIPEHLTDRMCSHYGLIIAQPMSIYPDLRVSDLEPMQIPYP